MLGRTTEASVLSIGKVGGGQADPTYYVESVAQGADDYYSGHGEAPGKWEGGGAAASGLTGTVESDTFLRTLEAEAKAGRKVLGFDLTFSAPKSVSVLFGIADEEVSAAVRDSHDEAVRQALGYMERHACWTRRGTDGVQRLQGEGLTVATFRHRTSRAGDPQLHTHAVVANRTIAEGRATALDGQALYAHARTAGFLYQAALRAQLVERVGVAWGPVERGTAEIEGFDEEVIKHFSRRSEEIRERMAVHGGHSARSAQAATLETRRRKDYDVAVTRLQDEWRARASELGLDASSLAGLLDRRIAGPASKPDIEQAGKAMLADNGITERASSFDRRDVLRAWAEAHPEGARVADLERLADDSLASSEVVRLESPAARVHLGGPRRSTPELLDTEHRLLAGAQDRKATGIAQVAAEQVATTVRGCGLFAEQRELVEALTTSGDGVQVVRAAAGTGKTRALSVARAVWEEDGIHVYGCALAARAAVELEQLAGIDSATVTQLERDIAAGHGLPRGSVLVVDEAGMVGTRTLERLASHCAATESKLVLVGDDRQLPEIDAGGSFRRLAEVLGTTELRTVHRQQHEWDRIALDALRRGRIDEWASAYREHGRLVAEPSADAVRQRLVEDWWHSAKEDACDAVMVAHRRSDVAELNALARARMREDGRLSEQELHSESGSFAVGDRVLLRRNDRRLDLVNGTRAEVTALHEDEHSLTVQLGDGTIRELDGQYLDRGALHHGYALTAHAAQGATVDRSFVLGSDELYREWGYTALTRHRDEARFYVVSPGSVERALPGLEPEPDPLDEDLRAVLTRSRRNTTARELLERSDGRYETPAPPAPAAPAIAPTAMQRPALRSRLVDPPATVTSTIGARPAALHERERWLRAAQRLVRDETLELDTSTADAMLPDTGLEL
jgi:conjugative relaxase-like TrwC/TraI family protein